MFVKRYQNRLVRGSSQEALQLRGVNMPANPNEIPGEHVYADLISIGMNTLSFFLDYQSFYDADSPYVYKPEIWNWLDQHIALAKKYNVLLVLRMAHIEGEQFVPRVDIPYDYTIWQDEEKQRRFIALWQEIARRYHHETQIAGYSLFLEPVCEQSLAQWTKLANETISQIRLVDKEHLIFVERIYGENKVRREFSGIELPLERAFPAISDENVAYEFYMFEQDAYTHQFAPWRPEPELRTSRSYPDENSIIIHREETGFTKAFVFDKHYLAFYIERYVQFAQTINAPLLLWGFGTARMTFTHNRGGAVWLQDTLDLLEQQHLHWLYWVYESDYAGLRNNPVAKELLQNALVGTK